MLKMSYAAAAAQLGVWAGVESGQPHSIIRTNISKKRLLLLHLVERLLLGTGEVRSELDVRSSGGSNVAPEVGGKEGVGLGDGLEGSLQEVTHGGRLTGRLGVAVLDTSELEHALRGGGGNDTRTTGSGHKTAHDRGRLTGNLHGDSVGLTESVTPVATSDGDGGKLGNNDGTTDGSSNFLGALNTETKVAVGVTNGNEGLETGTLTGTGLLLNGHDLHDLVLELGDKEVDDLVLLDGEGEEVDLLDRLDLAVLDESADRGNGNPFLLLAVATTTTTGATTASSTAVSSETATSTGCGSSVSHLVSEMIGSTIKIEAKQGC